MARTPPARTAGQRPLLALVALVVLAIGASTVAREQAEGSGSGGAERPAPVTAPSPEPGRTAEAVGPVRGVDVQAYTDDRTAALLEAPPTVDTAVVSLTDVLGLGDALAVVGGPDTVRAVLYRLPLAQAPPRTVRVGPGDDVGAALDAALAGQLDQLRTELAAARELLASDTVSDEAFVAEYERRVAEIEEALAAAEERRVVHALVVRAPLEALQRLVDATAVRLVDPAPPGTDIALSTFDGLLPSDIDTASQGRSG